MRIVDVLAAKTGTVVTVSPTDTVTALVAALTARNVGAAVVLDDERLAGIVSERDVVRGLHTHGAAVLDAPISKIMTSTVTTCRREDRVEDLSVTMTEQRIRHVPVLDADDALVGIVSIGDVVKSRIDQLEEHRVQLEAYISG